MRLMLFLRETTVRSHWSMVSYQKVNKSELNTKTAPLLVFHSAWRSQLPPCLILSYTLPLSSQTLHFNLWKLLKFLPPVSISLTTITTSKQGQYSTVFPSCTSQVQMPRRTTTLHLSRSSMLWATKARRHSRQHPASFSWTQSCVYVQLCVHMHAYMHEKLPQVLALRRPAPAPDAWEDLGGRERHMGKQGLS